MESFSHQRVKYLFITSMILFVIIQTFYYTKTYSLNLSCSSHNRISSSDVILQKLDILSDIRFQKICQQILRSTVIKQLGLNLSDINMLKILIDDFKGVANKSEINLDLQKKENKALYLDVCPEENHGYYKGFEILNCTDVKPFKRITTVVLNFVHYPLKYESLLRDLIQKVMAKYPNMTMHVGVQQKMFSDKRKPIPAKLHVVSEKTKDATIWNQLIDQVKTPYTFVARDILLFDEDWRLERLVRAISKLDISVAGGSMKDTKGYWNMACHQSVFRNYTLIYQFGYHHSEYDCLWCTHITGPFVARTNFLKTNRFDETLQSSTVFEDFFLKLYRNSDQVIVCPDSMFNVQTEYNTAYDKSDLLPFARKWQINQVQFSHTGLITFTCKELKLNCSKSIGKVLPPCCLQILADQIKLVMAMCEKNNIICQLNAGTTLGAIKFNGVLPWDLDADIHYLHANMSAMKNLKNIFVANGNRFVYEYTHGHNFFLYNSGWKIEIWHYDRMDSQIAIENGNVPTKVLFDGMWVNTFRNPALKMRVMYSPEIFRHVQHHLHLSKIRPATFTKCPFPGNQDCLDQYKIDGNFQFRLPQP